LRPMVNGVAIRGRRRDAKSFILATFLLWIIEAVVPKQLWDPREPFCEALRQPFSHFHPIFENHYFNTWRHFEGKKCVCETFQDWKKTFRACRLFKKSHVDSTHRLFCICYTKALVFRESKFQLFIQEWLKICAHDPAAGQRGAAPSKGKRTLLQSLQAGCLQPGVSPSLAWLPASFMPLVVRHS
jgi:hypothetical protein